MPVSGSTSLVTGLFEITIGFDQVGTAVGGALNAGERGVRRVQARALAEVHHVDQRAVGQHRDLVSDREQVLVLRRDVPRRRPCRAAVVVIEK